MAAMTEDEFDQRFTDARTLDQVRALARTVKEYRDEAEFWTDRPRYLLNQARVDRLLEKAEAIMQQGESLPAEENAPEIGLPAGIGYEPIAPKPEAPTTPQPEPEPESGLIIVEGNPGTAEWVERP